MPPLAATSAPMVERPPELKFSTDVAFTDLDNVVATTNGFALRFNVPALSGEQRVTFQDASGDVALIGAGLPDTRYLAADRNLSDLSDPVEARKNLGLTIGNEVPAWSEAAEDLTDGELSGERVGPGLRAASLTEGIIVPERLGSGTATIETYLRGDGTWQTVEKGGTVRSVALRMPDPFVVDGSPINKEGAFEVSLEKQSAARIFAGPLQGEPPGAPVFRRLESSDLPNHTHRGEEITEGIVAMERLPAMVARLDASSTEFAGNLGVGKSGTFFFGNTNTVALESSGGDFVVTAGGSRRLRIDSQGDYEFGAGADVVVDGKIGTRFGTEPNQKIGFYGSVPVARPEGDLANALENLGLVSNPVVSAAVIDSGTLADARLSWPLSELGKTLTSLADAPAIAKLLGLEPGKDVQPHSATLDQIAALSLSVVGKELLTVPDSKVAAEKLGLVAGKNVQAYSEELGRLASGTSSKLGRDWLGIATVESARKMLGVVPGTDVQAHSDNLDSLATVKPLAVGRELLATADVAAARKILGITPGLDVQPFDKNLAEIAAEKSTPFGRSLLASTDAGSLRGLIGAEPGRDVQPFDSDLVEIASLATTAYGRSLLASADAGALLASLGGNDATRLTTGVVAPARLGQGEPGGGTFLRGDGQWSSVAYNVGVHAKVWEEAEAGRAGGSFINGAWQVRALNKIEVQASSGITLTTANRVVLPPGTYRFQISAPARRVGSHQARLQNVTADKTLALGTSEYAGAADAGSQTRSCISGRFILDAVTEIEIQHRCSSPYANIGFGEPTGWGPEIYTVGEFWREP
jgi:hypothetical protein